MQMHECLQLFLSYTIKQGHDVTVDGGYFSRILIWAEI